MKILNEKQIASVVGNGVCQCSGESDTLDVPTEIGCINLCCSIIEARGYTYNAETNLCNLRVAEAARSVNLGSKRIMAPIPYSNS